LHSLGNGEAKNSPIEISSLIYLTINPFGQSLDLLASHSFDAAEGMLGCQGRKA
jgi:hypothetical protein